MVAIALTAAVALVPAARAKSGADTKPHTWTVVLQGGRVQSASSSPGSDEKVPVFKRGRGDMIKFVSRDKKYWVRFRTPSPLILKGEVAQRFEVFPMSGGTNPIFVLTSDAPPDSADWERFPFEIHDSQDVPKDAADSPRMTGTGARPTPPPVGKKKSDRPELEVDSVLDAVR
jgi:hypothetical protein